MWQFTDHEDGMLFSATCFFQWMVDHYIYGKHFMSYMKSYSSKQLTSCGVLCEFWTGIFPVALLKLKSKLDYDHIRHMIPTRHPSLSTCWGVGMTYSHNILYAMIWSWRQGLGGMISSQLLISGFWCDWWLWIPWTLQQGEQRQVCMMDNVNINDSTGHTNSDRA